MIRHLIHEVLDELDINPKKRKYKHTYKGKHRYGYKARKRYDHDDDHDHRYRATYSNHGGHRPWSGLLGLLIRLANGDGPYRHRNEYRHRDYRRRHRQWDD